MPNLYLNQWWNIVNWTFRNKFQWNFSPKALIFVQENVFENAVWKTAAILSWPQCVLNTLRLMWHLCNYVNNILMDQCKTAVTPVLMQWSHCNLALSHWYVPQSGGNIIPSTINLGTLPHKTKQLACQQLVYICSLKLGNNTSYKNYQTYKCVVSLLTVHSHIENTLELLSVIKSTNSNIQISHNCRIPSKIRIYFLGWLSLF